MLILLLALPACVGKKKQASKCSSRNDDAMMAHVGIPVAGDSIKSFFDQDLEEYALADEAAAVGLESPETINEYAWVEEDSRSSGNFKTVYFNFNDYAIKNTQEDNVKYDVVAAKKTLTQPEEAALVVEGHACHSAGSSIYNLTLSEKRAKVVADRLVSEGVPADHVKVVGRGQEVPAVINGKTVTGGREEQWPNRRVEVRVIAPAA